MAIAFGYQPISTLKEGFDAISEYQRLKLSKAMALLQSGSQFGQKEAIGEGFGYLGSKSAKNYTNETSPEQDAGQIPSSSQDIKKLPDEQLTNIDTINQIVYSAKDLPEAKNKLALIAKTIATRNNGGIDAGTAAQLATMDEGLETHYGRGYKGSNINWASLIAQPKRGVGGKGGNDYTIITSEGKLVPISASSNEEALAKYKKQTNDTGGSVFEGDAAKVMSSYSKWYNDITKGEVQLGTSDMEVKKLGGFLGIGGDRAIVHKGTDKPVEHGELMKLFSQLMNIPKQEAKKKNKGITQITPK